MKTVIIRTIDHRDQRYDTVGDWQDHYKLTITVSRLPDARHCQLLALHELVEAWLCEHAGVTQAAVDAFDLTYAGDGEPGADSRAPYHQQHMFACKLEELFAQQLGVDWTEYERALAALTQ